METYYQQVISILEFCACEVSSLAREIGVNEKALNKIIKRMIKNGYKIRYIEIGARRLYQLAGTENEPLPSAYMK